MDALAKVCPKCGRRYDTVATFCQTDGVRLQLTEESPDPYIGTRLLDQFLIEEKIGAGGMGAVYRARQTTLHRDVAIKILHPELTDNRDAVRRFKREARVCTALDHPNVVRVFLFGQLPDDSLYIVMEYLRGRPLLDVLRSDGALPVHRALHVATQICDGVGEAHAQGVVHRDLKPENVVLVPKQRDPDFVKVLDFGIARVLWGDEVTQATQSGLVFGTARYISPEGAAGESTDARSDVYSLGILTYQLLCGDTPFDAASPVAMLMKHIHSSPPHLLSHARARHVPEPVADVIMRALSKNPEGRYDDGVDFGDALRGAAERAGFEVEGRRSRASIGPPSEPGTRKAPDRAPSIPEARLSVPSTRHMPASEPTPIESETLSGAPSPFDDEHEEMLVAGLGSRGSKRGAIPWRTVGMAFAIGIAVVLAGFGATRWLGAEETPELDVDGLLVEASEALAAGAFDRPSGRNVLELTGRVLAERPGNAEALRLRREVAERLVRQAEGQAEDDRDTARATYARAARFTPEDPAIAAAIAALDEPVVPAAPPGVRTRPVHVVEDEEVTLVAVLEPDTDLGERLLPRFVIKRGRRSIGRAIEASVDDTGRTFEARYTFRSPGEHRVVFRIGRGSDRIERTVTIDVERDPNRPSRPRPEPDPPPVTTQGSVWSPPTIAPAWTTTTVGNPASNPPPPSNPPPSNPPPSNPPPVNPPPPWTGGGAVL